MSDPIPRLLRDPGQDLSKVRAALVWGLGLPGAPRSAAPFPALAALLEEVRAAGEGFLPEATRKAVRDALRHGSYKPAGRAKPSSEYLLAAALEGDFPLVNGPVDANNAASLRFGLPASVFDLAKTGPELLLSRGAEGESYAFNPSGQVIELRDLLLVRRRVGDSWEACGNPVKDAMATKVFEDCRAAAAVVYAPAALPAAGLEACAALLASWLGGESGARETGWILA